VSYTSEYPNIDPYKTDDEAQTIRTFVKSELWKYEQEYRFMNIYFDEGGASHDSPRRIIKLPDNFTLEVLLGVLMPDEHKKQIIDVARAKNMRVYQLEKVPFKFELDRHLIE